jgi:MFS family permease
MFAAPIAGIFLFTFFFSYSFFAIFIYGLSNVRHISSLFLSIREHARMTKNKIRKGTDVLPNTPFERFWLAINEIVDFMYIYIFYIAYIIILIYAGRDYQKNVESAGLKTGLIGLTAMLICIFVVLCISDFYMRYRDITNPLIAAVTPVIPVVNPIHEKENSITNVGQVLKSKDVKEKLDHLSNQVNSTLSTSSNFFSKISSDLASNLTTGLGKMMPSAEGLGKAFTQQKKV